MGKGLMKEKRGVSNFLVWVLIIVAIIGALYFIFQPAVGGKWFFEKSGTTVLTKVPKIIGDQFSPTSTVGKNFATLIGNVLGFVVGEVPVTSDGKTDKSGMSALIVILCIWAMMALLFGDVLRNFSMLSKEISFAIGVLLAIAAANLGVLSGFVSTLTGVFAGFGVAAMYLGLGASFVAFVAVEMGIGSLAPWIMRRKSMQEAVKAQHTTGTILDAIKHYKKVGKELATD